MVLGMFVVVGVGVGIVVVVVVVAVVVSRKSCSPLGGTLLYMGIGLSASRRQEDDVNKFAIVLWHRTTEHDILSRSKGATEHSRSLSA